MHCICGCHGDACFTLQSADDMRGFQSSAVEVLFDFAQYLTSACVQTNSVSNPSQGHDKVVTTWLQPCNGLD